MAEISIPWGSTAPGDAGPYSDDNWSDVWRELRTNNPAAQGVLDTYLNELAVTGSASPVSVATGAGMSDGKFYRNGSPVDIIIPTPSVSPRIDRIVLRKSWSAQTVRLTRIAGSEGGLAPSLVQVDGTTWDIPLAEITITTGGSITIVDERVKMVTNLRAGGLNREASMLEIVGNAITARRYAHSLVPEAGNTDDLETVNGLHTGDMGILIVDDPAADTITIKHGVGNIQCFGGTDITLQYGMVMYHFDGTNVIMGGGGGGGVATQIEESSGPTVLDIGAIADGQVLGRVGNDVVGVPLAAGLPQGYLFGLGLANNTSDATNDIDIAVGKARSDDDANDIVLAAPITKRLDAAWAVGSGNGGLDTGSIANTTYHVFIIKRSDTGVVDVLFSASPTAPTMPANYDIKRRIGSIVRTSGAILGFVQDGDLFTLKIPILDVNATNPGTSAVTRTLTLPTGIRVRARVSVGGAGTSGDPGPSAVYISDLSVDNVAAAGASAGSGVSFQGTASGTGGFLILIGQAEAMTNTSAQVRTRVQNSTSNTILLVNTNGWMDDRGRSR